MDIFDALVLDVSIVILAMLLLLWRGNLSHSHPATTYFVLSSSYFDDACTQS